jgi:hypothetical protein
MTRPSLLLLALALATAARAQAPFQLTSADMPQAGVTYPLVDATAPLSDLEAAGPNATWDFSDLQPLNDAPLTPQPLSAASITALFTFNSPFNPAYQSDFFLPTTFPDFGGQLPIDIPIDGFNNFYQTDGNHYTICGVGLTSSGFDLPVTYSDIDELLPLPCSYGASLNSSASFTLDLQGVLGYWLDQTRQITADGYGTLLLPGGSFPVLRTRTLLNASDSLLIPDLGTPFAFDREQVIYQWWGQGKGFPLLEVTTAFGLPVTARYQNLSVTPNGISEAAIEATAVTAWPNPTAQGNGWHLRGEDTPGAPRPWTLLDLQGRQVTSGTWNGSATVIPTADCGPGTYLLQTGTSSLRLQVQ